LLLYDQIYTGDCRDLSAMIPDSSVDLIFTDPPYIKKYLPLYSWLAEEARRILKPDGFLLAYAGGYWKAEIMQRIDHYLAYYFDFILVNSGPSPIIWNRKIIGRHKSVLAYTLPGSTAKPRTNVLSFFNGEKADKRYHEWGQDEVSARYLIDCFSMPGDLVVDFFCGGGTVPAMCQALDRRWLAYELDPEMAKVARGRLLSTDSVNGLHGLNHG
jgi:site-specific DNA-methyltransferase (adenine-specific)